MFESMSFDPIHIHVDWLWYLQRICSESISLQSKVVCSFISKYFINIGLQMLLSVCKYFMNHILFNTFSFVAHQIMIQSLVDDGNNKLFVLEWKRWAQYASRHFFFLLRFFMCRCCCFLVGVCATLRQTHPLININYERHAVVEHMYSSQLEIMKLQNMSPSLSLGWQMGSQNCRYVWTLFIECIDTNYG